MDDQNKNLILATVLSALVLLVWFVLFPPEQQAPSVAETATSDGVPAPAREAGAPPAGDGTLAVTPGAVPGVGVTPAESRANAVNASTRIPVDTPRLTGSISLTGGRIDDIALKDYKETLAPDSPIVTLLSPAGAPDAYYALHGWVPAGDLPSDAVPSASTEWTAPEGARLTPDTPLTLTWDNGTGLIFTRVISVDDDFMFTVAQSVENTGDVAVRMFPYDVDPTEGGRVGKYQITDEGWIGFADKYWMTMLIPSTGTPATSVVKYVDGGAIYQTETRMPVVEVAAGATVTSESRLFAGAKEWEELRYYQNEQGVPGFVDAIDWGWFFFLTKPIFQALHFLNALIGNMGLAIIVLTLGIKAILFPLAYKSYVSMARMKELQPEMEKLKEKAGDDRQKLQTGMMELYKKNKVNPAAGCLPILLQIPIFFSLYKVIFVTIELRHAPFFGPFQDLSAPDPTSLLNLFGLLPIAAPEAGTILALVFIGILPIMLGVSMWFQQKLNPAPADPTQAMIFAWLPWVFMFMLGSFASGLVVYWIANNTITFTQQYIIMRSHGSKPDLFGNIKSGFRKKAAANDVRPPSSKGK